ncbi:MAG: hypothetical protein ABR910_05635 [Acidobacteriaceae bacterium]|jgi:hypothetical protein
MVDFLKGDHASRVMWYSTAVMFAIAELIAVHRGYLVSRHSSFPNSVLAYAPVLIAVIPWTTGQKAFSLLRKSDVQPALRLTLEGMLTSIVTMTYLLLIVTVVFFTNP